MGTIKRISVFLLVLASIYWTVLQYLLMTVHADSRLQEIDYLQKTAPESQPRVLYIDKILPLTQRLTHFAIFRLTHKLPTPPHCPPPHPPQALLLISASSLDLVTVYSKLLRELQGSGQKCNVPEVYLLKRQLPLLLNNLENINKYSFEIGQIVKYLTIEAEYELSILTHEEGALLTLTYLTRRTINLLFTNIIQNIRTILFVDISHPLIRIQYDPPFRLLQKLKKEIIASPERTSLFNKLRLIFINTHKQNAKWHEHQLLYGDQLHTFARTVFMSSREMANVHYFLPSNSLTFLPLVRRLGHFLAKDFSTDLSPSETATFLKHGQNNEQQQIDSQQLAHCQYFSLQTNPNFTSRDTCITLLRSPLQQDQTVIIYAAQHFSVYSHSLHSLHPFDNLTQGSLYLLQQLLQQIHIINPEQIQIHVSKQTVATPQHPIALTEQELIAASPLVFSNYTVLRVCPSTLLAFPLHFAQGSLRRSFSTPSQQNCFIQSTIVEQFSQQFLTEWTLFRNMLIFSLLCSTYLDISVSNRLLQQFQINLMLLLGRSHIQNQLMSALYLMSLALLVEYALKLSIYAGSQISFKQRWASLILLLVSALCLLGYTFDLFSYWKVFLIAAVFVMNRQNVQIFAIKLYFLRDDIILDPADLQRVSDLILLTLWIYTSLVSQRETSESRWSAQQIFTGLLIVGVLLHLQSSGRMIQTLLTLYIKIMIVLRSLKMLRK